MSSRLSPLIQKLYLALVSAHEEKKGLWAPARIVDFLISVQKWRHFRRNTRWAAVNINRSEKIPIIHRHRVTSDSSADAEKHCINKVYFTVAKRKKVFLQRVVEKSIIDEFSVTLNWIFSRRD